MRGAPNAERLAAEFAAVERQWISTRQRWRDKVADDFERELWEPHLPMMQSLIRSMEQLEDELAQVLAEIRNAQ
jgi:hypothetical protein